MADYRKIVLILGNGFDLDLGLKTSYKDFWESEFCPKNYPAPLIHHLNQRWPGNLEAVKWYDLENELLNYYKSIPDPSKGQDILTPEEIELLKNYSTYGWQCHWFDAQTDLVQSLVDKGVLAFRKGLLPTVEEHYREDALQSPIWRDRKALQLIKDGLCEYLKAACNQSNIKDNSVAMNVLFAANCAKEAGNELRIYSFNYTRLPEDYGNDVQYVHGCCSRGSVIVGTRDDGMYDNNYDFLQKALDPNFNPPAIVPDILDADEVIIFGHSIGENDRQYFKAFFKQQADPACHRRKDIIIFTLDDYSKVEIKRSLQKMTDYNLSTLYSQNNIEIIKTTRIQDERSKLQKFVGNHIADTMQAMITLNQLLDKE